MKVVLIAAVILSGVFLQTSRYARTVSSTSILPQEHQLKLEIPKDIWEPIFFREINKRAKIAKLPSLRSGLPNDDLEARFWVEAGVFGMDGMVIRRNAGAWSGTHVYGISRDPNFKQYDEKMRQPRSGWDIAWKRLVDGGLLSLPDASRINCLIGGRDVSVFVFETNVNKTYRTYMYEEPELAECEEAKRMVKLIGIISDEFNLKWSATANSDARSRFRAKNNK